mgnify:CR=1 FL=1
MKLRSVNQREIGRGPATVLVNNLSHFDSGSVFTEHLKGLEIASDDWLVGINLDAQSLGELFQAATEAGCDRLSYWVNATGARHLETVLETLDMLAIDGVTPIGEWIVFDLTEATTTDGSAAEFLSGFLTSRRLQQPTSTQTRIPNVETQTSRRAVLLTELVHLAKPLKPYLPPSVIHAGYKLLGALK